MRRFLFPLAVSLLTPPAIASAEEDVAREDYEVFLDLLETEVAVTSATKVKTQVAEAPSMVTVIPRSDILAYGYRSVGEALRSVPGLYVTDDLVTYNVGIRGVYGGADSWSRIIKVMINGQPVTFHSTGGTLMGPELIPIDAVESIEVIRGPASALYGANAFLGVINIVTREAKPGGSLQVGLEGGLTREQPGGGGSLFASVGSSGERASSLVVAASAARLDRSGLGVPSMSADAAQYPDRVSAGDLSSPVSLFSRGTWDAGALGTIGLQLVLQRLDAHGEFSDVGVLTHGNRIALSNTVLRADHQKSFWNDQLKLSTWASSSWGETLPQETLDTGERAFTFHRSRSNVAFGAGTELGYFSGKHSALLGVDYFRADDQGDVVYQVARESSGAVNAGDRTLHSRGAPLRYDNYGAYAQGVFFPLDRLGLTGGLRFDRNTEWGNNFNARAGVVYRPLDPLHLKLLYGSSFLPPSATQLNTVPLRLLGVRGNPDLTSQTAHTVELGGSYRLNEHVSFQLNGFWTRTNDRIEFVYLETNLTARNLTGSTTVGAEASAEMRWNNVFAKANVSFQHTDVEAPNPAPSWWRTVYDPEAPGGQLPPGFPGWMGHLSAGTTLRALHLQPTVTLHVVGERKTSIANARIARSAYLLPAYAVVDASLRTLDLQAFEGRATQVSLTASNLFNTPYADAGALGVDLPALGRTVFLRVVQEL